MSTARDVIGDVTCQFSSTEEPSCELKALPNKPFCGKHALKIGNMEEMVQQNITGIKTQELLDKVGSKEKADVVALKREGRPEPITRPDQHQYDADGNPVETTQRITHKSGPAKRTADPEVQGGKLAEQLIQQEMQERMERFGLTSTPRHRRNEDGSTKKAPFAFTARKVRADSTQIVDVLTGQNPVPDGWVPRWVRRKDAYDRPNVARLQEFEDYGYVYVRDKNNQIIESHLGVAMMAPAQQYALRVKDNAPLGGITRESVVNEAREMVDRDNSKRGYEAARLYESEESKSERRVHEAGE